MKISLVIYGSLETISGGYLYDRKLVEFLKEQGDQVEIISLPWRGYLRSLADNGAPGLRRRLRAVDVDILLQDELNHPSLAWLNRRLTSQAPILTIVHHLRSSEFRLAWQNRLYALVERRYLGGVDGFIFNSRTTQNVVSKYMSPGDMARLPSLVAYPAGDRFQVEITPVEISSRARRDGPLRLIFLGNLILRKGLHLLLEALAALPSRAAELVVIGSPFIDAGYARRVQQRANLPDLAGRVLFRGALDEVRLAAELRQGQLLVVPSSYEGYGIAYLEGMSFGLPAIAGNVGAAGEIITDGRDGFLLPLNDPQALSSILAELSGNRQRLVELSLAARQRYLAQPTWQETGQKIRDFLLGLIS